MQSAVARGPDGRARRRGPRRRRDGPRGPAGVRRGLARGHGRQRAEVIGPVFDGWVRGDDGATIPGGEMVAGIVARVVRVLTEVADRHEGGAALVVSHGGAVMATVPELVGRPRPAPGTCSSVVAGTSSWCATAGRGPLPASIRIWTRPLPLTDPRGWPTCPEADLAPAARRTVWGVHGHEGKAALLVVGYAPRVAKKSKTKLPKVECCVSKSKCGRCPLRMLKEGTLPDGYTVKQRKPSGSTARRSPEEACEGRLNRPTRSTDARRTLRRTAQRPDRQRARRPQPVPRLRGLLRRADHAEDGRLLLRPGARGARPRDDDGPVPPRHRRGRRDPRRRGAGGHLRRRHRARARWPSRRRSG